MNLPISKQYPYPLRDWERRLLCLLASMTVACGTMPSDPTPSSTPALDIETIEFHFDAGTEEWSTFQSNDIDWRNDDVNGNGYATTLTEDPDSYWVMPPHMSGDLSAAVGIDFARRLEAYDYSPSDGIQLLSEMGWVLEFESEIDQVGSWVTSSVSFTDPSGWTMAAPERKDVITSSELARVLGEVSQIRIFTGHTGGSSNGTKADLDDVVISYRAGTPFPNEEPKYETLNVYEFSSDSEGWTIAAAETVGYQSAGGNPGGYMEAVIHSEDSYWIAPDSILEEASVATHLAFDRIIDDIGYSTIAADIFLYSTSGVKLGYKFPFSPAEVWTRFVVSLKDPTGWQQYAPNSSEYVSSEMLLDAVSNVDRIEIFGKHSGSTSNYYLIGLDNVATLKEIP